MVKYLMDAMKTTQDSNRNLNMPRPTADYSLNIKSYAPATPTTFTTAGSGNFTFHNSPKTPSIPTSSVTSASKFPVSEEYSRSGLPPLPKFTSYTSPEKIIENVRKSIDLTQDIYK